MNLPNMLTLFRIGLSPVFMVFFLWGTPTTRIVALCIVFISEWTDLLDGYLARKYKLVTDVGKLLDPLADRLFRFSIFLCFLVQGYAEIWMVAIFFYRDSIVSWLRTIAASQNQILAARMSGKLKALAQAAATFFIILLVTINDWTPVPHLTTISYSLMIMATVVTLYSGIEYFWANATVIKTAFMDKEQNA
ncbi:CDP-diacylglycerol--glycerol-3-phosphate 3-phosphatidyltransferase [Candidatus Uabimicrobium sp. HlEnr_7]|uniref:CDP-diacylglycerol--glycerol-3-phosphate 3-phosphatidyltransferase n=1 Tax=Candidatus Uabimicrobium helgolandensis TaxID=3095367 RepID=UPI0035587BC2